MLYNNLKMPNKNKAHKNKKKVFANFKQNVQFFFETYKKRCK